MNAKKRTLVHRVKETESVLVNVIIGTKGFTITTNGQVQVNDTGRTNLPRCFYRVIER